MAATPTPIASRNIGTSLTAVGSYTVPGATNAFVTDLVVTNVLGTDTTVSVTRYDGTNDFYLLKNATLVAGGSIRVTSDNRMALSAGYQIRVAGGAALSVDANASLLVIT